MGEEFMFQHLRSDKGYENECIDEHGNEFWETQESRGSHWGEFGGFARFAKGHDFITHAL
ncbi:unnamed protein product [Arabis nemorensis]|uniref:Uncharacterized protein n=1 Tax=Arabis nemorensis TaxID=586526 RepID=A0A565B1F7_9BRAS|nr:unnamed protein product [Arabis nemorensis]